MNESLLAFLLPQSPAIIYTIIYAATIKRRRDVNPCIPKSPLNGKYSVFQRRQGAARRKLVKEFHENWFEAVETAVCVDYSAHPAVA